MKRPRFSSGLCGLAALAAFGGQDLRAQGTAFMYQGRLTDNGAPADGNYELRFAIYDATAAGNAVGSPITNSPVAVAEGVFTTTLDFGANVFNGQARWLEIAVRTTGSSGAFTPLNPRQPLRQRCREK